YISMEYVDGEDLASLLRRIGRLPGDRAIQAARQLCAGLAAAHDQGILHRDLKPANVMIDGRGRVKITDFGLASLAEELHGAEVRAGTPAYMAPEQLAGTEFTQRSDIYALGLVLYELFTGKPALEGRTPAEIARRQESPPIRPSSIVAGLDPAVESIILRCLEKEPRDRPASALAVAAALPGGDPLAAALAAGETPSPELVAAAGQSEAMHIGPAAAIGLLIAAELVCLVFLTSAAGVHGYVPLDKPPQALEDRAREVLTKLGYTDEPADTAFGFDRNAPYMNWLQENDPSPNRWERLREPRPGGMYFWYRQSPGRFRPFPHDWITRGFVGSDNPPWQVPGEAYVSLDPAGRLRRFYVIPRPGISSPDEAAKPVEEADWPMLFDLAGLNFESFMPADPRLTLKFRVDERMAWSGLYPEAPGIAIQVEAGLVEGKPAYFRFVNPWEEPKPAPADAAQQPSSSMRLARFVERWRETVKFVIILSVLCGVGLVALSRHRAVGNLQGATRIACFAYVALLLGTLLDGEHLLPRTEDELMQAFTVATFFAVVVFSSYLALEPFARRLWPTMLVAWTRLLSGRMRDPLVGKSILVGTVCGSLIELLRALALNAPGWLGEPQWPMWYPLHLAGSVHHSLSHASMTVFYPIFFGFVYLSLLVLLRFLLRRQWLAAVVFLLIVPLMVGRDFQLLPWVPLSALLAALVILLVLLRFGVLALIACLYCTLMLQGAPLSPNLSAWYAHATLVPLGFVAAMACYGLYAATHGRPVFQTEFPKA
ncbi:MAG: serine/threonine-protein kinase, partial [Acidobacteriota bacterium]